MTHNQSPQPDDGADFWLAYRYLTGELSNAEAGEFESRLAGEFALQTALADAVTLTAGLPGIRRPSLPLARPTRTSTGASRWTVGIAAAAIWLIGLGLLLRSLSVPSGGVAVDHPGDPSAVVALWSALGPEMVDEINAMESQLAFDDSSASGEIEVPGWMLLAVRDDAGDQIDGLPTEGEPL